MQYYQMPAIDEIREIEHWNTYRTRREEHRPGVKSDRTTGKVKQVQDKLLWHARDHILAGTSDEIADVLAPSTPRREDEKTDVKALREGDVSFLAQAEKYLEHARKHEFFSEGYSTDYSVTGALPNVPAYLSGNPYNMIQRVRVRQAQAPLCMFFEATACNGGLYLLGQKGAACMALAMALSDLRPIELWVTITYGGSQTTMDGVNHPELKMIAARLETAPIDLALCCGWMSRFTFLAMQGSKAMQQHFGAYGHGWAYGARGLEQQWAGKILGRILFPGCQVLYVPAATLSDVNTYGDDLNAWIDEMINKYGQDLKEEG